MNAILLPLAASVALLASPASARPVPVPVREAPGWGLEAAWRHAYEGVEALRQGRLREAQAGLDRALDAAPSNDELRRMRSRLREAADLLPQMPRRDAEAYAAVADYVKDGDLSRALKVLASARS